MSWSSVSFRQGCVSLFWDNGFEGKSVNWVSVDSSVFTSAAYLHGKRLLYLRFHSGDIYRYFDFSPDQYDEFVAADSKGEYFAYNIRDKFRYEQVREAQTFTTGSR